MERAQLSGLEREEQIKRDKRECLREIVKRVPETAFNLTPQGLFYGPAAVVAGAVLSYLDVISSNAAIYTITSGGVVFLGGAAGTFANFALYGPVIQGGPPKLSNGIERIKRNWQKYKELKKGRTSEEIHSSQ